jgi:uncharacterized protein (DUF58 family)
MKQIHPKDVNLSNLQAVGGLELLAKQVVEGFLVGLHKSPFHGFSVEFAEHRLYNQGESTRHIDWKLYGRTDKLFVKKYEEETNLRCHLIIDNSSSMQYPSKEYNKLRFAVYCAASIIHLLKNQRDAVGVSLFSDGLEKHFPAKSSAIHQKLLFSELEKLLITQHLNKGTSTADALHLISQSIHRRSLVVIFSDILDDIDKIESTFSALQHLKYNKHEVILFHTYDKKQEIDFVFENRPYLFVDMESGEKVKLFPNEVKAKYADYVAHWRGKIKERCHQFKIDYVEADINEGFYQVLQPYLMKRTKMY